MGTEAPGRSWHSVFSMSGVVPTKIHCLLMKVPGHLVEVGFW